MPHEKAILTLAYALYDSEHTTRLSEHPEDLPAYKDRASKLFYAIRYYRPKRERVELARRLRSRT